MIEFKNLTSELLFEIRAGCVGMAVEALHDRFKDNNDLYIEKINSLAREIEKFIFSDIPVKSPQNKVTIVKLEKN